MSDYKGDDSVRGTSESSVQSDFQGKSYRPQVGDRVRVTFEGDYLDGVIKAGPSFWIYRNGISAIRSIEKIEPPVEVFEPGDTVRSKSGGFLYSIGSDGYFSHPARHFFEWGYGIGEKHFTSKDYERVNLS